MWTLFQWVWRVESPLFIGMPPAGALNRCRLYVPARALWGAITAEITRREKFNEDPEGELNEKYSKTGNDVKNHCRFTYLYPAEEIEGKYIPWLPNYEEKEGLIWCNNKGKKSEREFRRSILHTRPGTAIDPNTDSSSDGSLRETECINPWWAAQLGEQPQPVFLLGYVFLKNVNNCGMEDKLKQIKTLYLGGDTRYGLGKIERNRWTNVSNIKKVFEASATLDKEEPTIQSDTVWGHVQDENNIPFLRGKREFSGGWNKTQQCLGNCMWAPGSNLNQKEGKNWLIDADGHWNLFT